MNALLCIFKQRFLSFSSSPTSTSSSSSTSSPSPLTKHLTVLKSKLNKYVEKIDKSIILLNSLVLQINPKINDEKRLKKSLFEKLLLLESISFFEEQVNKIFKIYMNDVEELFMFAKEYSYQGHRNSNNESKYIYM
jgi:hypothetical protein